MQTGTRFACQLHGQFRRPVAGLFRADGRMTFDGHFLSILLLHLLRVLFHNRLILAVCSNEQVRSAEYLAQTFHVVHQHIACAGSHKQLHAAHPVAFQLAEEREVVVCCTEIARVVHRRAFAHQSQFLVERLNRCCLRLRIRHIHDRSHPSGSRSPAFREDIRLMSESRIAEMHVLVDGTRQQITAFGIDDFALSCFSSRLFICREKSSQLTLIFNFAFLDGGNPFIFNQHRANEAFAFIYDDGILYPNTFHFFCGNL